MCGGCKKCGACFEEGGAEKKICKEDGYCHKNCETCANCVDPCAMPCSYNGRGCRERCWKCLDDGSENLDDCKSGGWCETKCMDCHDCVMPFLQMGMGSGTV